NGLTNKEAQKRLSVDGKNVIEKAKKMSFIKCFFKQFLNIMVIILLISSLISIVMAIADKEYSGLFEGFVILFIVLTNSLIGVFQEMKAQSCLEELQKYNKISVKVIRNGISQMVDSTELVCGDIVVMEAGNVVMADIRLISANNFSCDESSLTGESVPVEKNADVILKKNTAIGERVNVAFSGSLITSGKACGVVFATGRNTEIGKIAKMLYATKKETTPLQKSINKIGKIITWSVVAVSIVIMGFELISGNTMFNSMMTAVALAVAAIPESLPAVITIIMALGVQQLAKRKCIIKHLHAVETLGSCEIICTDKTGTLTQNKMQVVDVCFNLKNNQKIFDEEFIKCLYCCNTSKVEDMKVVGEPTDKALMEYALKIIEENRFENYNKKVIHEIPFNSTRKKMSVLVDDGGLKCYSKGAPEKIIKNCKFIKINGKIEHFSNEFKEKIQKINNEMTDKAYRVIGFSCKNLNEFNPNDDLEDDMVFLGLVGLMDNPRPEVKASIENCFKAGLKPIMITGDHKRTAFAIAKELGIATNLDQVITGEELDKLSDKELKKKCKNICVYARVSPEHKVRIVSSYKSLNKIVAMTGDGVNDAPSLKIADIGVGMGKGGTDVVKSVADMLVTDDNFSSIVVAVEEGRKVYSNIQKALQFLISTNCVEIFGMLISLIFFPQYTFLLPSQMLFINLVGDSLPAFALGMEKVEKEVMETPPRNPKAGLFSGAVGVAIIYQSILQTAIVMVVFMIGVFCYSAEDASTMVFFTMVFMQLLHSVNCKTNGSIFEKNLVDNKTFNFCFVLTLVLGLIVACVPFMYKLFNLEFLNLSQWVVVVIASILIIPACELIKAILFNDKKIYKNFKKIKNKAKNY
ncbi:MAG: cation-translocating P-type ATPase, partial [Clostridia bacterium]|nr:cation-translocating P-type ATPase [Clostridia bacterium]